MTDVEPDVLILPVETVDTEYEEMDGEDYEEEEQEKPDEVEEEEELASEATLEAREEPSADYVLPEENKDVWKNFGYETEAGRMLRKLYAGNSKDAAARVSYPRLVSPARRWEPEAKPRGACPQRAPVRVPGPARRKIDRDDPKNWYVPMPGRKPAEQILAEMEAHKPQKPPMVRGRDQGAEKKGLQNKFRYAGGNAMPPGAMGHVPKGQVPNIEECRGMAGGQDEKWDNVDETGLTKEQRGIFQDLTAAVAYKQKRIAEIDAQDAAEGDPGRDINKAKEKTKRNKEALQLQNDIQGCMRDMDKLLEITD